jgi:hypothetical protein
VTIDDSIEIEKPPEAVWTLVRDLERAPEWQESLESVDVAAGTEVRRFAGRAQDATFVIVEEVADGAGQLLRVDPSTNAVTKRVAVGRRTNSVRETIPGPPGVAMLALFGGDVFASATSNEVWRLTPG